MDNRKGRKVSIKQRKEGIHKGDITRYPRYPYHKGIQGKGKVSIKR
jgi:hypothetical protein